MAARPVAELYRNHFYVVRWSWLLRYNVSVVVVKTLLQIPGCIFSAVMQEHACWLVQLLGIGCVDKFAGGNIAKFLKMEYVKVSIVLLFYMYVCIYLKHGLGILMFFTSLCR